MRSSILSSLLLKVSQNASMGFVVSLFLLVLLASSSSYSQTERILDYTNKSTPANTDAFLISEADHDYFYTTWSNIKTTLTATALTWTPIQYFNGAKFNAGTHGTLEVNDTLWVRGEARFDDPTWLNDLTFCYMMYPASTTYWSTIGASTLPYKRMYSNMFVLVNQTNTDSAKMYFDAGKIYSDFPLSVKLDSAPDSASSSIGSYNLPYDTLYAVGLVAPNYMAIISQNEGIPTAALDSIWQYGVVIKPGILHYKQTQTPNASTTSLRVTSEVIILNAEVSGGVCDTLYIGDAISANLGAPIVTIYNQATTTFTITDTDGAGYNYCIRLPGTATDITLGQYDSIRLWFDANKTQWVYLGSADNN